MTTFYLHYIGIEGDEPSKAVKYESTSTDPFEVFCLGYQSFDEEPLYELERRDFVFQYFEGVFEGWTIIDIGSQGDPELWLLLKSSD